MSSRLLALLLLGCILILILGLTVAPWVVEAVTR